LRVQGRGMRLEGGGAVRCAGVEDNLCDLLFYCSLLLALLLASSAVLLSFGFLRLGVWGLG